MDTVEVTLLNLQSQTELVFSQEGRVQVSHLVDDAPKGPNIALFIILTFVYLLRAHIERSAYVGLGIYRLVTYGFSKTKVPELGVLLVVQENIGRFQISVQDHFLVFASVTFEESQHNLHQHLPNKVFRDVLLALFALLHELGEITTSTVLHYDVDGSIFLVYYFVIVTNDVLMLKLSEDVDFVD